MNGDINILDQKKKYDHPPNKSFLVQQIKISEWQVKNGSHPLSNMPLNCVTLSKNLPLLGLHLSNEVNLFWYLPHMELGYNTICIYVFI